MKYRIGFFLIIQLQLFVAAFNIIGAQEIDFDPIVWADTGLVQVSFKDNPKNDKAFFILPPEGWISVKDLTRMFNPDLLKRMSKNQLLKSYQSVYPFVVIAKSLDAIAWNNDPYNFKVPITDLQKVALEYLIEEYAEYKKITRKPFDHEAIYQEIVKEVDNQEFSFPMTMSKCANQNLKKVCSLLKSKKLFFELPDKTIVFNEFPKTIEQFNQAIVPMLHQWFSSSRRHHVIRSIFNQIELKNSKKSKSFITSLNTINQKKDDLQNNQQKEFYDLLWNNISVLTFADYCDFPTLICNRFDAQNFQIPLTSKTVERLISINFFD